MQQFSALPITSYNHLLKNTTLCLLKINSFYGKKAFVAVSSLQIPVNSAAFSLTLQP